MAAGPRHGGSHLFSHNLPSSPPARIISAASPVLPLDPLYVYLLYLFICINIFVFRVWNSVLAFRKARIMFVLPVLSFNRKQRAGTFRLCLFRVCVVCLFFFFFSFFFLFFFFFFTGLLVQLLGNHYLVCKNKGKIYWRVQLSGGVTLCMSIL